jgi:microcystin-dependent protein
MSIPIKVSELTVLNTITSDDYIVINDSGSTTTQRATIDTLGDFLAISPKAVNSSSYAKSSSYALSASYAKNSTSSSYALSASYAKSSSYSLSSSYALRTSNATTASYALKYSRIETFSTALSNIAGNANEIVQIDTPDNDAGGYHYTTGIMACLQVAGNIASTSKFYFITSMGKLGYGGNGSPSHDGYSGFYDLKPLVSSADYINTVPPFTNWALEISQSNSSRLTLRIRTLYTTALTPDHAALSLFMPFVTDPSLSTGPEAFSKKLTKLTGTEIVSSNDLPAWPSSIVEIKNYGVTVSGSMQVERGVSGSFLGNLTGTSSWANNVVGGSSGLITGAHYPITSSWATSSLSASYLSGSHTGSTFGTSSWATNALTAAYASSAQSVPVGSILDFAGTSVPDSSKWAVCDGSQLLISEYPELFAVIGTLWGNGDVGKFYIPNLCRRTTVGSGGTNIGGNLGTFVGDLNNLTDEIVSVTVGAHRHVFGKKLRAKNVDDDVALIEYYGNIAQGAGYYPDNTGCTKNGNMTVMVVTGNSGATQLKRTGEALVNFYNATGGVTGTVPKMTEYTNTDKWMDLVTTYPVYEYKITTSTSPSAARFLKDSPDDVAVGETSIDASSNSVNIMQPSAVVLKMIRTRP